MKKKVTRILVVDCERARGGVSLYLCTGMVSMKEGSRSLDALGPPPTLFKVFVTLIIRLAEYNELRGLEHM